MALNLTANLTGSFGLTCVADAGVSGKPCYVGRLPDARWIAWGDEIGGMALCENEDAARGWCRRFYFPVRPSRFFPPGPNAVNPAFELQAKFGLTDVVNLTPVEFSGDGQSWLVGRMPDGSWLAWNGVLAEYPIDFWYSVDEAGARQYWAEALDMINNATVKMGRRKSTH